MLAFHATVNATVTGGSAGGLVSPVVSRDEQMLLVFSLLVMITAKKRFDRLDGVAPAPPR